MAARRRNREPVLASRVNPDADHLFGVRGSLRRRLAIGHASGQIGHFDEKQLVLGAPLAGRSRLLLGHFRGHHHELPVYPAWYCTDCEPVLQDHRKDLFPSKIIVRALNSALEDSGGILGVWAQRGVRVYDKEDFGTLAGSGRSRHCCLVLHILLEINACSGHVGFFVESTATEIRLLGGNQSDKVGESSYPRERLMGYRLPS